jgi:hypothetical protein
MRNLVSSASLRTTPLEFDLGGGILARVLRAKDPVTHE